MAQANNYAHINAIQGSPQVLSPAACTLYAVTINSMGATSNILTLVDGNGTTIAVIDTTQNVGSLFYKVQCLGGLTAQLTAGTAADVTVAWG